MLEANQQPQHAPSILQADFLNRMGRELVHLCDGMERHGLVDYQMGVWEEDIVNSMYWCLTQSNRSGVGPNYPLRSSPTMP